MPIIPLRALVKIYGDNQGLFFDKRICYAAQRKLAEFALREGNTFYFYGSENDYSRCRTHKAWIVDRAVLDVTQIGDFSYSSGPGAHAHIMRAQGFRWTAALVGHAPLIVRYTDEATRLILQAKGVITDSVAQHRKAANELAKRANARVTWYDSMVELDWIDARGEPRMDKPRALAEAMGYRPESMVLPPKCG